MTKKAALVTGGTRGIGWGIASCLAAEGYDLTLCGIRQEKSVSSILDSLRRMGGEVFYTQADISDPSARQRLLTFAREHMGCLHLLVNNAGMAPRERKDILEASEESFEEVLRVNLQGPYFLTQSVAHWMIQQKNESSNFWGCIINISSISATVASPSRGEYCISKAGITMATKLWATRLGEFDIPVYEIRPGLIATDMTSSVSKKYDALIEKGLLLQSRWGKPEDVGRIVAVLARGDLSYSTGTVITADGGLTVDRL